MGSSMMLYRPHTLSCRYLYWPPGAWIKPREWLPIGHQPIQSSLINTRAEQLLMISRSGPTRGPDNAKDIWILGAGFSRQIHGDMPLMSDLAESVRDIVSERFDNPLILNDVELALSELQSDAPWKSPADKHTDLGLYETVIERIRDQLQIPYGEKRNGQADATLGQRLVNTWHINRNHVLTFNYDLLVEALAVSVKCQNYRDGDDKQKVRFMFPHYIYPIPIPHVLTRKGGTWRGNPNEITFSYYKLHGSLNYYTHPAPFQNTTMYHKHHNQVEDIAEGLRTFIVPPGNDKRTFIEHPVLQAIWTKAVKELANCDRGRIIMVGYSLPQTDLTVLSMLRAAIRSDDIDGRVLPEILVVNPDPGVAHHVKKLLGVPNPVGQVTDVTGFLEQYAPLKFVRTHVWDNRHLEVDEKLHRIYQESGGKVSEEYLALANEIRKKARASGRLGREWFLSREEFADWRQSVLRHAHVNCWL